MAKDWIVVFLIVYGVVSIYYGIVNSFAIGIFESEYKDMYETLRKNKNFRIYINILPYVMAVLSIFWPIFLVLKKFIKIKVTELEE